ncbi:MAG: phosphoribosylformylglycinamidine synthase I [Rickettsiales bacterium]|nr:phosphoribosylformylglycinamidine synthase I [Rickettsiales bacterium]
MAKNIVSIIVFPGSNCDRDLAVAVKSCLGVEPQLIWHDTAHIKETNLILLPGGFSYGDYLRAGVIATKSPAIKEIVRLGLNGVPIIGICNGFQILTECNLLEGALIKNSHQLFECRDIYLKVENTNNIFFKNLKRETIMNFPIANSQGNFFINENNLKSLEDNDQIVLKYSSVNGKVNISNNPNGSVNNIAGIVNKKKNIMGLMPHPERAFDTFSSRDGKIFFDCLKDLL